MQVLSCKFKAFIYRHLKISISVIRQCLVMKLWWIGISIAIEWAAASWWRQSNSMDIRRNCFVPWVLNVNECSNAWLEAPPRSSIPLFFFRKKGRQTDIPNYFTDFPLWFILFVWSFATLKDNMQSRHAPHLPCTYTVFFIHHRSPLLPLSVSCAVSVMRR